MQRIAIYFSCVLLVQGCASKPQPTRCSVKPNDIISEVDIHKLMDDIVVGLCLPTTDLDSQKKDLTVVPDFVEMNSLQPARIGVVLGESLRASIFNICKIPIRQVELSKNFKLNSNGLMALSRNYTEVREEKFPVATAIIGTYDISGTKLSLVVRRIDIESASFLAVTSKTVNWKCDESTDGEKKIIFDIK